MLTEREVLVSVLKLTKVGQAVVDEIGREARIPVQIVYEVLRKNSDLGIVQLEGKSVMAGIEQRLRAAIRAIELGADIERVCKFLTWSEFEDLAVLAFKANDFTVRKHFRLNWSGRGWEIDLLGLREPIVASVDCKQWHRRWSGSSSRKAAERQIERTKALAEASRDMTEKIGIKGWKRASFMPIILSLMPSAQKFHGGTPMVPVLQLRDFLQEMPAFISEIAHFSVSYLSI